jgi:hypothetical protein
VRSDAAYRTGRRITIGNKLRVATSLNVRQTFAVLTVDPARTVAASIAAGGLFTPVRGRITSMPAYLLFVEAKCASDLEARRLEMLHLRLADAGVNVKRFFYFDSPAWLYEDFGGNPRPIEDVAAFYEDRRLIILGEGRGFLMPLSNTLQPWTQVLSMWPQRAMLTPRSLKEWGHQEFAIANRLGLPLGRATVEGLFALAELLGLDESRDRPLFRAYGFTGGFDLKPLPALIRSQSYYWLSENDPGPADAKRLDSVLRYYLDGEGLLWLKALAVYPALQWDLTIYLGRELAIYEEPRLAALTLLPWLREGHMPQWLRRRFIASLPDDIRVRTIAAIHRLMAADETPQKGRRTLLSPADPMRRPSLRGREPSRDGLFIETLANEGDFPAPAWMKPSLRKWFATLSWNDLGVAAAAGLYAAAACWLAPTPADGALGPGAFMPLTMLALMPVLGWLGLAWFEDRVQISASLASWWAQIKEYPSKRLPAEFRRVITTLDEKRVPAQETQSELGWRPFLGTRLGAWIEELLRYAKAEISDGRERARSWLMSGEEAKIGRSAAKKLLVWYHHRDRHQFEQLRTALIPFQKSGRIELSAQDDKVLTNSDLIDENGERITGSDIALLLVSPDFLASEILDQQQLPRLLQERERGMGLFWIPIQPSLFEKTPFREIQAIWDPSRPLSTLRERERMSALTEIAERIDSWDRSNFAKEVASQRQSP